MSNKALSLHRVLLLPAAAYRQVERQKLQLDWILKPFRQRHVDYHRGRLRRRARSWHISERKLNPSGREYLCTTDGRATRQGRHSKYRSMYSENFRGFCPRVQLASATWGLVIFHCTGENKRNSTYSVPNVRFSRSTRSSAKLSRFLSCVTRLVHGLMARASRTRCVKKTNSVTAKGAAGAPATEKRCRRHAGPRNGNHHRHGRPSLDGSPSQFSRQRFNQKSACMFGSGLGFPCSSSQGLSHPCCYQPIPLFARAAFIFVPTE